MIGYSARRELAAKLRRAGYPAPPQMEGLVVNELARAGLFGFAPRSSVRWPIGPYSGVVGLKLPDELVTTEDMDIAKFYGISIWIDESMPDIEEILKKVDPTCAPSFSPDETKLFSGFANATGFKVEFLTPNRGDEDYSSRLTQIPSLWQSVGAQVLRFLDYLIHEPIRSVVLHDAGVPVLVPAPERYAVHKLIIATKRNVFFADKAKKDINQAGALIQAFNAVKRSSDLGFAWMEAWERGARWRRRLGVGALRLSDDTFEMLAKGVAEAAKLDGKPGRGVRAYGRQGRSFWRAFQLRIRRRRQRRDANSTCRRGSLAHHRRRPRKP